MTIRTVITGSIQCGKSSFIRSIVEELPYPVVGYYSQKRWRPTKNRTEIWLTDYYCHDATCFAFFEKDKSYQVDLETFDQFIEKSLTPLSVSESHLLCIDEIGFLEKESAVLQTKCKQFINLQIPVLLVIQKRILHAFLDIFTSPHWVFYDLDEVKRDKTRETILKNIKSFYGF